MDVYGEQSWWNFSCHLYISLFDGRPKRHRSDLQMSLWMEILSREKLHLLIYFVLFLTTLRMCCRSMKGILGSCESLCLIFIMLFNFFLVSFVVGSLWVVLRSSSVIWRSLWVVPGFSDYWSVGWKPNYVTLNNPESYKFYKNFILSETIK